MKALVRLAVAGMAAAGLVVTLSGSASAVLGGKPATTGKYPYLIAIETPDHQELCTGALIAPDKVLSAAHCFDDMDVTGLRFIGGRTDLGTTKGQVRHAVKVKVHPDYQGFAGDYDAALVTLDKALPYRTVPVARPADSALYGYGRPATVLGWGRTGTETAVANSDAAAAGRRLKEATLKLAPMSDCGPWSSTSAVKICGLPRSAVPESVCAGDSGGPLIAGGRVIGIVSSGNKYCTPDTAYSTFSRVSSVAAGLGLRTWSP